VIEPGADGRAADGDPHARLHAEFRPVRGRRTATAIGIAQAVVLVYTAFAMSSVGSDAAHWWDRLGVLLVSAAVGAMLWRFARLAAIAQAGGLMVRNLSADRHLAWAEIVAVRFGGGNPWVTLDLADGETLAVMAIQRADGPRAEAEARRLATLVELHSRTDRDG
jgi:Bacterial PH domain